MARKTTEYFFAIARELVERMHPSSLLDMLRYDGATPMRTESGYWLFRSPHVPTVDRWASFGVPVRFYDTGLSSLADTIRIIDTKEAQS